MWYLSWVLWENESISFLLSPIKQQQNTDVNPAFNHFPTGFLRQGGKTFKPHSHPQTSWQRQNWEETGGFWHQSSFTSWSSGFQSLKDAVVPSSQRMWSSLDSMELQVIFFLREPLGWSSGSLRSRGCCGPGFQGNVAQLGLTRASEPFCFCFTSGATQFLWLGIWISEYERMLWSQFPREVAHPVGVSEAWSLTSLFLSCGTPLTRDNNNNNNNNNNVGFDVGEVNVQ